MEQSQVAIVLDKYLLVRVVELVFQRDEPPKCLFKIISLKIMYMFIYKMFNIFVCTCIYMYIYMLTSDINCLIMFYLNMYVIIFQFKSINN